MTIVQKLFSLRGRLRRRDWWLLRIGLFVVHLVLLLVSSRLSHQTVPEWANEQKPGGGVLLLNLILFWPSLALDVKRLHDRNRSGFWLLPFLVFHYVWMVLDIMAGAAIAIPAEFAIKQTITWGGLVILIAYFVELGFRDSRRGAERFGPSPKGGIEPDAAEAFA